MKSTFASFGHRVAPVASALTVTCALAFGGPALAQLHEPTTKRATARLIDIDEIPVTTGEYAQMSDRVVWARCLSVEVRQLSGSAIETYFEFEILETVKGTFAGGHRPGARFVIVIPEGRVGEFRSESLPPFPKFVPGDEAVLLVGGDRPQNLPGAVISPTQSTYRVRIDTKGRKTVTPRPTGMTLYRAADGRAHGRMPDRPTLEDFMFSLRKLDGG